MYIVNKKYDLILKENKIVFFYICIWIIFNIIMLYFVLNKYFFVWIGNELRMLVLKIW